MTWILIVPAILISLAFLAVAAAWVFLIVLFYLDNKKSKQHQPETTYRVLNFEQH